MWGLRRKRQEGQRQDRETEGRQRVLAKTNLRSLPATRMLGTQVQTLAWEASTRTGQLEPMRVLKLCDL